MSAHRQHYTPETGHTSEPESSALRGALQAVALTLACVALSLLLAHGWAAA